MVDVVYVWLSLPQDLREKNWKAMDALNCMEKIAQKSTQLSVEIENKDSLLRSLKEDVQRAKRQNYVRDHLTVQMHIYDTSRLSVVLTAKPRGCVPFSADANTILFCYSPPCMLSLVTQLHTFVF